MNTAGMHVVAGTQGACLTTHTADKAAITSAYCFAAERSTVKRRGVPGVRLHG